MRAPRRSREFKQRSPMTDSEKIAAIISAKHLTNVQFCQAAGIQPSALSHITSGRTKPSLPLLRGIANGFPDINPHWLFLDQGEMYAVPPGEASTASARPTPQASGPQEAGDPPRRPPLPSGVDANEGLEPPLPPDAAEASGRAQVPLSPPPMAAPPPRAAAPLPSTPPPAAQPACQVGAPSGASALEPAGMSQPKARQRNIVEIRVFFDDNTYEVLLPGRH